ncbi:hypothetical protein WT92_33400 [Burkholderia stagnalis]|uniref:Uncharacterized protein n=1 Tax=Burkholderia stagnalis TaxID=1503054 RepID=A0A107AI98_9BURK|nr:hypothetical protein WT35_27380 [Burkholderia stagnalis]KWA45003.1 hypothetical protein WT42_29785 [Burkholderia stagnalis]KWA53118.1 hypothetical protein WT44_30160 [Burkholderia stagnalis]KWA57962.1 hypothetical protein WT43_00605 [Burkholderia stagnalis]KWD02163.1 hypothetical protein WT45_10685 [Burkholderia stagnalis]
MSAIVSDAIIGAPWLILLAARKKVRWFGRGKSLHFLFELAVVLPVIRFWGKSLAGVLLHEAIELTS